jgi:hypothetical protein
MHYTFSIFEDYDLVLNHVAAKAFARAATAAISDLCTHRHCIRNITAYLRIVG